MKIEHIAMYVNDLEKTKDFFIKYFHAKSNDGYHNKTTDFRSYFLSFDDGTRLEIILNTNSSFVCFIWKYTDKKPQFNLSHLLTYSLGAPLWKVLFNHHSSIDLPQSPLSGPILCFFCSSQRHYSQLLHAYI